MILCNFSNGGRAVVIMAMSSPAYVQYPRLDYTAPMVQIHNSYQRSFKKWYNEGNDGIVSLSVLCPNEHPGCMLLGELSWNQE